MQQFVKLNRAVDVRLMPRGEAGVACEQAESESFMPLCQVHVPDAYGRRSSLTASAELRSYQSETAATLVPPSSNCSDMRCCTSPASSNLQLSWTR